MTDLYELRGCIENKTYWFFTGCVDITLNKVFTDRLLLPTAFIALMAGSLRKKTKLFKTFVHACIQSNMRFKTFSLFDNLTSILYIDNAS